MTLGTKMKKLRELRGWRLADLARRSGVDLKTLAAIEARDSKRSEFAPQIARALDVRLDELLSGDSSKSVLPPTLHGATRTRDAGNLNVKEVALAVGRVPLISWKTAWRWTEVQDTYQYGADEHIETSVRVGRHAFALEVVGDSMYREGDQRSIPDGATVVIDPSREPSHKDVILVKRERDNLFCLRQLWFDGSRPYLKPLNDAYPTIEFAGDIVIVGRAMESLIRVKL